MDEQAPQARPGAHDPSATLANILCCSSEAGFSPYEALIRAVTMPSPDPMGELMRRRNFLGALGGAAVVYGRCRCAHKSVRPVSASFSMETL